MNIFGLGKIKVDNTLQGKLKREYQKSGAYKTMTFKEWYNKRTDKMIQSWMVA